LNPLPKSLALLGEMNYEWLMENGLIENLVASNIRINFITTEPCSPELWNHG
jgi:hypothetical protein